MCHRHALASFFRGSFHDPAKAFYGIVEGRDPPCGKVDFQRSLFDKFQ